MLDCIVREDPTHGLGWQERVDSGMLVAVQRDRIVEAEERQ